MEAGSRGTPPTPTPPPEKYCSAGERSLGVPACEDRGVMRGVEGPKFGVPLWGGRRSRVRGALAAAAPPPSLTSQASKARTARRRSLGAREWRSKEWLLLPRCRSSPAPLPQKWNPLAAEKRASASGKAHPRRVLGGADMKPPGEARRGQWQIMCSLGGKMGEEEEEEEGVGATGTAAEAAAAASMGLTARPRGEEEKVDCKRGRRTLRRRGWNEGALVG